MDGLDEKDEILVSYLLNEQSRTQNEELEDEMSLQPALEERLQVVEMSLIDSYVLNQMSPAEKARFEKGFFLLSENRRKVDEARAFHQSLRPQTQAAAAAIPTPRRRFSLAWVPLSRNPAFGVAALVLIASLIIGISILISKNGIFKNDSQVKREQESPASSVNQNREGTGSNLAEVSPTPANQPTNQSPSRPNKVVASIAEIGLTGVGGSRGANSGQGVTKPLLIEIPGDARHFTLQVKLKADNRLSNIVECSVDISDSKFQAVYPKGEENYLKVKINRVAGDLPYQISFKVPTDFLREGKLYNLRVRETEKRTPFRIRFVS